MRPLTRIFAGSSPGKYHLGPSSLVRTCRSPCISHSVSFRGGALPPTSARFSSSNSRQSVDERNQQMAIYACAVVIGVVGLSYGSVPLYQMFCQATGYGGTTQKATEEQFKNMKPVEGGRPITVYFLADTAASMPWSFTPQQKYVKVVPGETALAFYTAHNPTDVPITGVSTYNVTPARAGLYFHKIQCFCFEEQRLRPHEEIDMPVFFYVDPSIADDASLTGLRTISLSYTFFRTASEETDTEDVLAAAAQGGKSGFDLAAAQAAHQKQLDDMRAHTPPGKQATSSAGPSTVSGGVYDPVPPRVAAPPTTTRQQSEAMSASAEPSGTESQQARIARWTAETAAKLGVKQPLPPSR